MANEKKPLIITAKTKEEALTIALGESSDEMLRLIYRSLNQLRSDRSMAVFIKDCIRPVLERKVKALKNEPDHSEVRYIQGYIAGIEKCIDLDDFLKTYKIKLEKQINGQS